MRVKRWEESSGGGATKGIRAASAGSSDLGGTCRNWLKEVGSDVHPEEKGGIPRARSRKRWVGLGTTQDTAKATLGVGC